MFSINCIQHCMDILIRIHTPYTYSPAWYCIMYTVYTNTKNLYISYTYTIYLYMHNIYTRIDDSSTFHVFWQDRLLPQTAVKSLSCFPKRKTQGLADNWRSRIKGRLVHICIYLYLCAYVKTNILLYMYAISNTLS